MRNRLVAIKGFLDRRAPGYLVFFVTPFCNCRCRMCFYAKAIDSAEKRAILTLGEIERIARGFPGLHHVNLTGGEPFLRDDLDEIPGLFYRHSGARFFTVATNSSLPDKTEADVERICNSCPDAWIRVNQSLDGVGESHDAVRGKPGLFDSVLELNRRLARLSERLPNLSVAVISVLSRYNQDHIFELLEYVYEHLQFNDYGVLFVRGETRDPGARELERDTYRRIQLACGEKRMGKRTSRGLEDRAYAAIHRTAAQLLTEVVSGNRCVTPCKAVRHMVVMDDEGGIEPCEILAEYIREKRVALASSSLGNIRDFDYDIRKALATSRAREMVDHIVKSRCFCTYECAMAANVLYTPRLWGKVARNLLLV